MTEFKIPQPNVGRLQHEFAKLARRAAKLGVPVPTLTLGATIREVVEKKELSASGFWKSVDTYRTYQFVEVTGEAPQRAGYTFVAKLSFEQSRPTVFTVPGEETPVKYRDADPKLCDHCQSRRARKDVFVVRKGDEYLQIGRNCLSDFLGGRDPAKVANWLTYWRSFLEGECEDAGEEGYRDVRIPTQWGIDQILTITSAVIERDGWTSVGAAKAYNEKINDSLGEDEHSDSYKVATKAEVLRQLYPERHKKERDFVPVEPTEKDESRALATIALVKDIWAAKETKSDYEYNSVVAVEDEYCTDKTLGIICSLIAAYQRHINDEFERATRAERVRGTKHIGEVGERSEFDLTVAAVISLSGQFGPVDLYKFVDADGNEVAWLSSSDIELEVGETYRLKATVKKHDHYQGAPQTTINRAVLVEAELEGGDVDF